MVSEDLYNLKKFFIENKKIALCFSGGVNSSYLLYAGLKYGNNIRAYYVKSEFQPQSDLDNVISFAKLYNADLRILELKLLSDPEIAKNNTSRCYLCKKRMASLIKEQAKKDGYSIIIDGAKHSNIDKQSMHKSTHNEFIVFSPLKECGITKFKVRVLSRKAGLRNWEKPSYGCLATQVPMGTRITTKLLTKIERAEQNLIAIGLEDVRVQLVGKHAKLEFPNLQMEKVVKKREKIIERLGADFDSILLALDPVRRSGC